VATLVAVVLPNHSQGRPTYHCRIIAVNDFWLTMANFGQIGIPFDDPEEDRRELGIRYVPSLEYPPLSHDEYLGSIEFRFGYIRGLDTMVVPTASWVPDGVITESTRLRGSYGYDPAATADLQFSSVFSDTSFYSSLYGFDYATFRTYKPAGLVVRQTAYAWSVPFARRFVIFDYTIRNISDRPIGHAVAGISVSPDIQNRVVWPGWSLEPRSVCGFIGTVPGLVAGAIDTINTAWVADADGDPVHGSWTRESMRAALGFRILRPTGVPLSFNWRGDLYDQWWPGAVIEHRWGPGRAGQPPEGWGWGAEYHTMTNREIDYDQVCSALDFSHAGWNPPSSRRDYNIRLARGGHISFTLSAGPMPTIPPGDSAQFTFALILGRELHNYPGNYIYHLDAFAPQGYLDRLDFSDLRLGARWADWTHDLPGYDTDGDGYRGAAHLVNCVSGRCDSLFYRGDGVADFRTPQPPSPPAFETSSRPGQVTLRWTGETPETELDPMSGRRDFEGYRLYAGRTPSDDQLSLLASWDAENFDQFVFDTTSERWRQVSHPRTAEQWRVVMHDPDLNPADYSSADPALAYRDTVTDTIRDYYGDIIGIEERERLSCWRREDANRGNLYADEGTLYTNMIQRIGARDTLIGEEIVTYGIYEATIGNLNPALPMHFAVTAFDYGNYIVSLVPLESSPAINTLYAQPIYSPDVVADSGLRVSVYPNPYRIIYADAHGNPTTYFREGYEGHGVPKFEEWDRRIHFVNLPEKATIRIFTFDGDLIRTINHPDPFLTTYPSAVSWDLVSRNLQAVVSGIYIWRVDAESGTQMGKLVIIK